AIAAGEWHYLALTEGGKVFGWGYDGDEEIDVPEDLSNVTSIAAGYYHSLALKSDGTVVSWGGQMPSNAKLGNVPSYVTNVLAIAGGNDFSMALKSNGTVVVWGDSSWGQNNVPSDLTNAVAI